MGVFHQAINSQSRNYNAKVYADTIIPVHFHKNPEVIYVKSGRVRCNCEGKEFILEKGEWGMCLPYDIHSFTPEPESIYWICVFSTDYVGEFIKSMEGKTGSFRFSCRKAVEDYLLSELVEKNESSELSLKAELYALCAEFVRSGGVHERKVDSENTSLRAKIVDYVSENFRSDISLRSLAKAVGYDYHYLSRVFHGIFGTSFCSFLSTYRIEAALELLKNSEMKIVDIACESGFQSVRSFNSHFVARFGMSPSEYRRREGRDI